MNAYEKINLLGLDRRAMQEFIVGIDEKPFRAAQLLKWIHQYGVSDFNAMTNLSKDFRARLHEIAVIRAPAVIQDELAADGTRKWLLRLDDGNCIETVFIPETGRGTLCVSSQAGCVLNCTFCSTGHQGFSRNLNTAEIISQLWLANAALGGNPNGGRVISNVVLMGMGEPLLNFSNVVTAMRLMLDDFAYGLSRRRVTLSTAGVVPMIDELRKTCAVSLAVSLHAPNDALRDQLVPLNKKYPINDLLAACRRYAYGRERQSRAAKITFEYVMLAGVNDSLAHAQELTALLSKVPAKVNLIPFNTFPQTNFRCSPWGSIDRFREVLLKAGLITVTRKTRGEKIDAACGQLAGRIRDRTRRRERMMSVPVNFQ